MTTLNRIRDRLSRLDELVRRDDGSDDTTFRITEAEHWIVDDARLLLVAVDVVLGHQANMHGENYHYAHGYADAVANIRHVNTEALGDRHG